MPSKMPVKCSEELNNTDEIEQINEVIRANESASEHMNVLEVASTHPYMDVNEAEEFQNKLMDLCDKVLNDEQANESQRRQFISLVKQIVYDTLHNS